MQLGTRVCSPHLAAMVTRQNSPEHLDPLLSYADDTLRRINDKISAQDLKIGEISTRTS